uniref:CUB domain-containing protein n=1 Tax=Megaselia scalaris TaxID=36166 RepID=T1GF97_MEGSC
MLKQIVVLLAFVAFAAHGFPGGKIKCGSSISSKTFTLSNPSNPPNDCVYKVKSYSSKVCQLRLDIEMVLAAPTVSNVQSGRNNTKCVDDFLEIGEYKFCGREPNQHIYIPFSEKTTEIRVFSSSRSGGSLLPRVSWNIRVKQLECPKGLSASSVLPYSDFDLLAPAGCLQYFQEKTGLISSFNLDSGRGSYTSGLSYAICLK